MKRPHWGKFCAYVALLAVTWCMFLLFTSPKADARPVMDGHPVWCKDLWMEDHTVADEDRCREEGWTVRWRYVLSPNGQRIWTGYPPCEYEDGRECYWNAHAFGNKRGHSFVQMGNLGTFYVRWINGHRA